MHLKQIKIAGFKSFADPQDLAVQTGLTGIVGPNGCGKSNLLESLRWVMGASSARAMRGTAMDDLIFSGSGNRSARNLAEVGLYLDNSARNAPPAFNDSDTLEIIRRIKRGVGSNFTVNGQPARAKDIRLIFADASTGANSPSLVRQGQISELIAARPENRRRILEEAAGIAGLNARRHEAELKLKNAEANLERCQDIEGEITRQLASLKRQAVKAEKYRALTLQMQELGLYIAGQTWRIDAEAEQEAKALLDAAHRKISEAEHAESRAEKERLDKNGELTPLRQKASVAGAKLGQIRIEHAKIEAQLNVSAEALAAQKREEARLREDLCALNEQIRDLSETQTTLKRWLQNNPPLDEQDYKSKIQSLRARKSSLTDDVFDAESDLNALRDALAKAKAEQAAFATQETSARTRFEKTKANLARAQAERAKLSNIAEVAAGMEKLSAEFNCLKHAQSLSESKLKSLEAEYESDIAKQKQAENDLAERRISVQRLKAELGGVGDVLATSDQFYEDPVLNQVQVADGYEAAVSSVLGDDLQGSLNTGQPLHWRGAVQSGALLPTECATLARFVKGPDALSARLSQCGIVETKDIGDRLAASLKQGQRLVTKDGHMWRWDGFVRLANAPRKEAETLKLIRRKKELEAQLTTANSQFESAIRISESCRDQSEKLKAHLKETEAQKVKSQSDIQANQNATERAQMALQTLQERHRMVASSIDAAQAEYDDAKQAVTEIDNRADVTARENLEPQIQDKLSALQELRQRERALDIEETELTRVFSEQETAIERNRQDADKADIRLESANTRQSRTQKALQSLREKIATSDTAPEALQERFSVLKAQIQTLESERLDANEALSRAEAQYAAAAQLAKVCAADSATAREAKIKCELIHDSALGKLAESLMHIEGRFSISPESLDFDALEAEARRYKWPDNLGELRALEIKLAEQREQLGGVNMEAAREAEDLMARAESHAEDRADLEEAIGKLRQAIAELNDKGREKLLTAYEAVNTHFKSLFTRLFGGGQAELKLVNAADPLAAGLEIYAQPPGKKLATLALMSGGEQALTATALIFAVFLSQPSPICVLDEVDAPLDDANVARFCDLLDSMRHQTDTRFIVITHNPVTMSRMDRLFGVTMREKGVSRLVSVDLQSANKMVA